MNLVTRALNKVLFFPFKLKQNEIFVQFSFMHIILIFVYNIVVTFCYNIYLYLVVLLKSYDRAVSYFS
ncbi:hypothetical protein FJR70_03405 [Bacillus tropicus]|nr:hypothetical protein FJR70_03405 [Bacillus tropicus]